MRTAPDAQADSKRVLRRKLNNARRVCSLYLTERRGTQRGNWCLKVWVIEDVEEFEAQLEVLLLVNLEYLRHIYIGVNVVRGKKRVHAGRAKGPSAICSECRGSNP